jgi:hypothetical protein
MSSNACVRISDVFRDLPPEKREQLKQRWQDMSPEERNQRLDSHRGKGSDGRQRQERRWRRRRSQRQGQEARPGRPLTASLVARCLAAGSRAAGAQGQTALTAAINSATAF